jgi:hemolysin III
MQPGDIVPCFGFAEPVASLAHYVAAVVAAAAAPGLLRSAGPSPVRRGVMAVFVISVVALFLASGTFHSCAHGSVEREVARRVDHAAIWVLIAGSLTAIHALALREPWRWWIIAAIWTAASAGIVLKALYVEGLPEWTWLALYLGLGWMGILVLLRIAYLHGWARIRLLAIGGLLYSVGALLDLARVPVVMPGVIGSHEVFHFAVIGGVFFHWRYVRQLAIEPEPSAAPSPEHVDPRTTFGSACA